jgi:SAM-dependent methyltransferase
MFRPHYPKHLFVYLASLCNAHDVAWDCATGSGQAAIGLAEKFHEVIATDASENQILNATPVKGVTYSVAPAEQSDLPANSVDLITVAQALHWFDIAAFTAEADRVLKTQGVLAVWTYGVLTVDNELDSIIEHFYSDIIGKYWPFERQMVEGGYADIEMPFNEVPTNPMEMTEHWHFATLIGYLNTWSAVRAYEKEQGQNPLDLVYDDLLKAWGDPAREHIVTWTLILRAWQKMRDVADH